MVSSTSPPASPVNLLAYLRSKSSVDLDCLDLKGETEIKDSVCDANHSIVATDLGPFSDCTSNQASELDWRYWQNTNGGAQWEAYSQLCNPQNAALLKESVALARQLQGQHVSVSVEELAVEIAVRSAFT